MINNDKYRLDIPDLINPSIKYGKNSEKPNRFYYFYAVRLKFLDLNFWFI